MLAIISTLAFLSSEVFARGVKAYRGSLVLLHAFLFCRLFEIDMTTCSVCGGPLSIIAAIVDPPVISKILAHLGLPQRAPPRAPVKAFPLFQTA